MALVASQHHKLNMVILLCYKGRCSAMEFNRYLKVRICKTWHIQIYRYIIFHNETRFERLQTFGTAVCTLPIHFMNYKIHGNSYHWLKYIGGMVKAQMTWDKSLKVYIKMWNGLVQLHIHILIYHLNKLHTGWLSYTW